MPLVDEVDVVVVVLCELHAVSDIIPVCEVYHVLGENRLHAGDIEYIYHAYPVIAFQLDVHVHSGGIGDIIVIVEKFQLAVTDEFSQCLGCLFALRKLFLDLVEVIDKLTVIVNETVRIGESKGIIFLSCRFFADNGYNESAVGEGISAVYAGYLALGQTSAYIGVLVGGKLSFYAV